MTTQKSKTKEELKGTIKGSVLVPNDPGYEEGRQIWNAMIDRRPAFIVQCAQADDVPPVIRFARENGLELSVRGAGHNIAGNALCDNGVTLDFSRMKNVRVDAGKKRAYVEPGATLADLDAAVQAHGLAAAYGSNYERLVEIKKRYDPENVFHLNQNIKP
jgi:FAD/FMN-containing dehydrogenase